MASRAEEPQWTGRQKFHKNMTREICSSSCMQVWFLRKQISISEFRRTIYNPGLAEMNEFSWFPPANRASSVMGADDVSESPDHSGFRDFSLGDENVLREAFLSALLWFTHNHQRQGLWKRPNQPRYTTSRYGWSSRSYRNKDKARGRSRRVPRWRSIPSSCLPPLLSFLPPPVASLPFLLSHIDFFPLFHFFSFDSAGLVADDSFFPSVSDWYHSHKTFPLFVAAMWHSPSFPSIFPSK